MDNKSTTKRMIGAVVLVLIAALLLAWLLKGKNRGMEEKNLISEQTQEASPILGFPGVKDGQGQLAGAGQEAGADQNTVIGTANPDAAAQQQAQNALNGQVQGAADAAAGGVAAVTGAVTGAVGGVVDAGKEAVQGLASQAQGDTTGFQVRDPNGEVRQVVDGGKAEAGVGSMGADVATAEKATDGAGAGQQAAGNADAAQSSNTVTASTASRNDAGSQTGDNGSSRIVNPRLVNEKPVPAPTSRVASSASSTSAGSASSATSAASSAGADGYVIQVLATSNKGKADGVKKSIAVDGYPAFVAQAKVDGKTVYRVRIGTYPGKGDASAVQARMKARYSQNQYVQNSFVTKN